MMRTKKKVWITVLCMLMLTAMLPLQVFAASKKASIKLDSKEKTITVGSSAMLIATVTGKSSKVTWKSSNPKVAAVSKGKITAKKAGKVTITAKANGKTAKCTVTVKAVDYKRLYKKFLEKKSVKAGKYTITPKYFYVLNIDKSGVPELIVTERPMGLCTYYVYTVKNNKVSYMGEYTAQGVVANPPLYYSSKYKAVFAEGWTNFVGGTWQNYYGISGSKLVRKQHCRAWTYPKNEYAIGETNNKEKVVTKAKYNSFYKKYFKNGKIKKYEMQENTAANREKYIK